MPAMARVTSASIGALALTAALALTGCAGTTRDTPSGAVAIKTATPAEALQLLRRGNERFVAGRLVHQDLLAQVATTSKGQKPYAVVLGCIDSRVPPEIVFDQGIGDIFVGRVAGNFVSTDMLGSFEFATELTGSQLIVVLGHSECGAVKGACDGAKLGNLTHTLANIMPAVEAVKTDGERNSSNKKFVQAVAEENVRLTVDRMTEKSPVMSALVEQGKLTVVGAMYDVATGKVTFMDS